MRGGRDMEVQAGREGVEGGERDGVGGGEREGVGGGKGLGGVEVRVWPLPPPLALLPPPLHRHFLLPMPLQPATALPLLLQPNCHPNRRSNRSLIYHSTACW